MYNQNFSSSRLARLLSSFLFRVLILFTSFHIFLKPGDTNSCVINTEPTIRRIIFTNEQRFYSIRECLIYLRQMP